MAAVPSWKRFKTCVQCGTTVIFPAWSEDARIRKTNDFRHCPVCEHGFSKTDSFAIRPNLDATRLEEFFSRFS